MLLGREFVAMLLIIVYVGAVAVLFLFVVMMLDVDFAELKAEMAQYMPLGLLIGRRHADATGHGFGRLELPMRQAARSGQLSQHPQAERTKHRALGLLIYDTIHHLFQLAGLILLVAMIGAIVLTLRHRDRYQAPERRCSKCTAIRPRRWN